MIYRLIRIVVGSIFRLAYRFDVSGIENVPVDRPAIVVANHLSFIDSFFIPVALRKRRVTFVAKADYFNRPTTAWFMKLLSQIPCERGAVNGGIALDVAEQEMSRGRVITMYPEGTRSRSGRLHRGHTGAARLAARTGAVLVPCGITGTDKVMPIGMRRPRLRGRKHVTVAFQRPIKVRRLEGIDAELAARPITDLAMLRIRRATGQVYVDHYANRKLPKAEEAERVLTPIG